jgi:hypothetical protein
MNASKPYNLLGPFRQQRKRNGYDIMRVDPEPLQHSSYSSSAEKCVDYWIPWPVLIRPQRVLRALDFADGIAFNAPNFC